MDTEKYRRSTKLVHIGRKPEEYHGVVNPPVVRTSTILYENLEAYLNPNTKYRYGRLGNPLSDSFEEPMAEIEGGYKAVSTCSGLAAITTAILSVVKTGDHVLFVDACYPPARFFCNSQLKKMGVEVEFYDPCIGAGIEKLIRPNTSLIYMETPCSATFEVQDVPAIVKIAKKHKIVTIMDNTWSGGILFQPIKHGVNVVIQSAAKYIGGHSDVNMGIIVADTPELYKDIKVTAMNLGQCAGSEELYLGGRGLRTIEMRYTQVAKNMLPVLEWFKSRQEAQELFSPVLETSRGHEIWKRDFSGANGMFSVLFQPEYSVTDIARFVNSLKLFPVGSSWGGYESLIQPQDMKAYRANWAKEGFFLRFQIGFEDPQDLIEDLENGIKNLEC